MDVPPLSPVFVVHIVIVAGVFSAALFGLGLYAFNTGIKVGYTRKCALFVMFLLPSAHAAYAGVGEQDTRLGLSTAGTGIAVAAMLPAVRRRSRISSTMFAAIDRPEDRPNTLLRLISQAAVGYCILGIFYAPFVLYSAPTDLLYMTVLATVVGDGLAEPVGLRFGRHKYRTRGLLTSTTYVRSIEGSSVVLNCFGRISSGIPVVLFFYWICLHARDLPGRADLG